MFKINRLLLVMLVIFKSTVMLGQDTVLVGKAMNAKAGAVVVTKNNMTYYIEGIDYWDSLVYGKMIKITGKMKLIKHKKRKKKKAEIHFQEISNDYWIITPIKWEIIGGTKPPNSTSM